MALSGNSGIGGKNYYINSGIVKSVDIKYNVPVKSASDKITDVEMVVVLDMVKENGEHFDKSIYISGNYKRNEITNQVDDWGSAFKIRQFFNVAGLNKWTTDDFGILPEGIAKQAEGATIYTISYLSSDDEGTKYRTYKMVAKSAEQIEKMFLKDVAGDYPPYKYEPKVEEDFPFGDSDKLVEEDII